MKYRRLPVFAVLLFLICVLLPVQAATAYIHDEAVLVSATKAQQLDARASEISENYGCGVYIVAVLDYSRYGSDVREAAENYFLARDFGLGADDNGVMLFLSTMDRDYALIAHGDIGNGAFTDYGKELLCEEFLDNFHYDDWAGGFADYLSACEAFLRSAATGTPVDIGQESDTGTTLIMVLLVPLLIAGIACGIMAGSMKNARAGTHADVYRKEVNLTNRQDRFITRTVVRQKIESSSSSSGGTSVNSRGFSGRSGKF